LSQGDWELRFESLVCGLLMGGPGPKYAEPIPAEVEAPDESDAAFLPGGANCKQSQSQGARFPGARVITQHVIMADVMTRHTTCRFHVNPSRLMKYLGEMYIN
jgi:hypothetical protein